MSKRNEVHFEMLSAQVASVFKFYIGSTKDKWSIGGFEPMLVDSKPIVSYLVEQDPEHQARRRITIKVSVDERVYKFFQNFNFGVPLDGGVTYTPISPEKDIIDLEYALSIATEHTAAQIAKRSE